MELNPESCFHLENNDSNGLVGLDILVPYCLWAQLDVLDPHFLWFQVDVIGSILFVVPI